MGVIPVVSHVTEPAVKHPFHTHTHTHTHSHAHITKAVAKAATRRVTHLPM